MFVDFEYPSVGLFTFVCVVGGLGTCLLTLFLVVVLCVVVGRGFEATTTLLPLFGLVYFLVPPEFDEELPR